MSKTLQVVIRGGVPDYEDPIGAEFSSGDRNRYPADYVFRLVDVVVKKSADELKWHWKI